MSDPQALLDVLRSAFDEATVADPVGREFVERLYAKLDGPRETCATVPSRLPACRHVGTAVATLEARAEVSDSGPPASRAEPTAGRASIASAAAVARALASLAPSLAWYRRVGADSRDVSFRDAHANAFIIGRDGLERRADAAVGVSLLAPRTRYPDHRHPPEELYFVLSPGSWRHGGSPWFEPGVGGTVRNEPDIVHAMRSGDEPLLAIWCLL